jgi:predicted unusual protein kinase regulating ubiquinone biosynthesis (AarF/ABC1/UbiB family)
VQRTARLGALPAGMAGRAAAGWFRKLGGADREVLAAELATKNADQIFEVLGNLKGGAMKLGQVLSVYEAMIPADLAGPYQDALIRLQANAPAMPASDVHRVLDEQLGKAWSKRFSEFDADTAHAASIGQVHRAIWHDGREVAVKIQYPGADHALMSDLRTLQRFARLIQIITPGADVRALLKEIADRMSEELDYRAEAEHQRAFAAEFETDKTVFVPKVVASAPKVIISEWVHGIPLSQLVNRPAKSADEQLVRDRIGHAAVELMFSSPARVGLLHSDPHPGNFRLMPDGRLGVLDFGATTEIPDGVPPSLGRILWLAAQHRSDEMMALLDSEGFVGYRDEVTGEDVQRFLGAFADPLRHDRFHFNRAFTRAEGGRVTDLRGDFKTVQAMNLPPQYLMMVRVVVGWFSILAQIDCTVSTKEIVQRWLPGFGD